MKDKEMRFFNLKQQRLLRGRRNTLKTSSKTVFTSSRQDKVAGQVGSVLQHTCPLPLLFFDQMCGGGRHCCQESLPQCFQVWRIEALGRTAHP